MTRNDDAAAIHVRDANADDVALMARWQQAMAQETEAKALDADTITRGIALALGDASRGCYYLAQVDGEPAGMLMLTREWSDWRCGWWWWIQSVYVASGHRRRGVYRALHRHVLALAQARADVAGLRLYVERENATAQGTYQSLGMVDAGYLMFETELRARPER